MSMRKTATDGATLRRARLMDLVTYIARYDQGPCTLEAIQTFMLLRHGNRRDTVEEYLRELRVTGVLTLSKGTGGYKLKRSWEETIGLFAAAGADYE